MKVNLLPHQDDFVFAKEKFAMLLGGIGSGKSHAGAVFVIKESLDDPKPNGLITANTYKQLTNATLTTLFKLCDEYAIEYKYNQNKGWIDIEGAHWYVYSLDNYDNLRGIEVGRFYADELRDASYEAFSVMLGRLRDKRAKKLSGRITTTPNGYDYLYDYFVGDKKTPEFKIIHARSFDNKYLPDGFVDTLKASYDDKVYRQEVLGEFINIQSGRIYYAFDRDKHVKPTKYNPAYPIYIGNDFNVNPMTAAIGQIINNVVHIFDEIFLADSNTPEMGNRIRLKYGTNLTIIPDSTGNKRTTASPTGKSDIQILKDFGFNVQTSGNPYRVDRYNTVNNLLEKNRIIIDASCVKLIKDLEQVSYKEGFNTPDTSDSSLTHISDAMGYLAWFAFPILPRATMPKMIPR